MAVTEGETARLDALAELEELALAAGVSERRFDRVLRLAQKIFDVPMVAVNLIGRDEQVTKAGIGLEGVAPRSDAFCSRTIESPDVFVVTDARRDRRFADNPFVTGAPGVRFYAGQPLAAPGGERVGALCLVSPEPREFSDAEASLLRDLADWVEKELALDEELAQAADVQGALLPQRPPESAEFDVAGRCMPARKVGGDFYDWFSHQDGSVQVVLADVMGKGIGAAIIAASVRAVLRGASRYNELPDAVTRAARALQPDLDETSTFVTAFTACCHPDGRVEYVDAGHGLAVVLTPGGDYRRVTTGDLPFGADDTWEWSSAETVLAPGETLIAVSDGFLDVFDSAAEGLAVISGLSREAAGADDLVRRVGALRGSAGGELAEDDMTVVAVRRRAA